MSKTKKLAMRDARLLKVLLDIDGLFRQLVPRAPPSGFAILLHLALNGVSRIGALGTSLKLNQSKCSRAVALLEEGGYVTRSTPDEDARATDVELAPKGYELIDSLLRVGRLHREF